MWKILPSTKIVPTIGRVTMRLEGGREIGEETSLPLPALPEGSIVVKPISSSNHLDCLGSVTKLSQVTWELLKGSP